MNTPLDGVRDKLGLRPAGSSPRRGRQTHSATAFTPEFSSMVRAGGHPEALSNGARWFLGFTTAVSAIVALTHQLLISALAAAHGQVTRELWSVSRTFKAGACTTGV